MNDDPAPAPEPAASDPPNAVYFDGTSSRKRTVTLRLETHGLDIVENGARLATWACDDLRKTSAPNGMLRLSSATALPLARLEVRDPALQHEILSRSAFLKADGAATGRQTGRIVGWSLAAIVSIVVVVVYGMPVVAERLAPIIPFWVEERLGDAGKQQVRLMFGGRVCTGAEGGKALASLVDKLKAAGGVAPTLELEVLSSSTPNAFALAGGKVYLLDGLLQKAESVDELAGVLAHELGHIHHRDHLRRMIYNGGTSFLIGLLFGDVTGSGAAIFATQTLLESSYSRDAETNADDFAITVMHKLGRSPKPLGEFLFRITGSEKSSRGASILASHPMTDERLRITSAAHRPNTGPELLTPAEWRALKAICRSS